MQVYWQRTIDPLGYSTHEFVAEPLGHRKVTGSIWIPEQNNHKGALVAFLHGASGTRFQAPIPYLAGKLATLGVASISIDGPVHGLRKKLDGGRIALYVEMSNRRAFCHLFKDWEIALQLAKLKLKHRVESLGYFGLSMGTFFGIPYLAERHRTNQITTVAVLGILAPTGVVSPFRSRLLRDAASVQLPLLFFVQEEDEMFKCTNCIELFNELASPTKQIRKNSGKHTDIPLEEIDFACKFMCEHLLVPLNTEEKSP